MQQLVLDSYENMLDMKYNLHYRPLQLWHMTLDKSCGTAIPLIVHSGFLYEKANRFTLGKLEGTSRVNWNISTEKSVHSRLGKREILEQEH